MYFILNRYITSIGTNLAGHTYQQVPVPEMPAIDQAQRLVH